MHGRTRLLALMPIIMLTGCGKEAVPAAPPRPVETMVVGRSDGGTSSVYPGQIVSRYEGRLGFRIAGTLIAKAVDVGDTVAAGQVLARIDPADVKLSASSAQAQTSAAASNASQQAIDLARSRTLLAQGFISQAEYDRQKVGVDQARAQLRSAQTQREGANRQVGYTILRAERAGVVTAFDGDVGQVVPAGQPVVTIATPDAIEASISVPEGEVEPLRRATLSVRTWSNPAITYTGRIRTLSPAASAQSRTFDARVAFAAPTGQAPIGSTAEVTATSPTGAGTLRLPVAALTQQNGRTVVWVVAGTPARVAARAVRVVQVQQNAVLIGDGLKGGERVVTAGVHLLHQNDVVRPVASSRDAPR